MHEILGGMSMSHTMYKIGDSPSRAIPFKLLYITHSTYDKGWHSTSHTHHFTELFYIVKGKGSFQLTTHDIPVIKNDLVIINPHVEHTETSNEDDPLEYIALGLEGVSFTLPDEDQSPIGLFTYQDDQRDVLFYLQKLLDEVNKQAEDYASICRNIIEILIVKLRRAKEMTVKTNEPKKLSQSVALVKYYIDQNYQDPLTLDTLASVGNINKYYLAHIFKEEVGSSPIDYLIQVRMKEAKTFLESTDYTIAEISEFSGFSSPSFFSQAFKRETKETPSSYRKKAHQKE